MERSTFSNEGGVLPQQPAAQPPAAAEAAARAAGAAALAAPAAAAALSNPVAPSSAVPPPPEAAGKPASAVAAGAMKKAAGEKPLLGDAAAPELAEQQQETKEQQQRLSEGVDSSSNVEAVWRCSGCWVMNSATDAKCPCCEAPRPGSPVQPDGAGAAAGNAGGATAGFLPGAANKQLPQGGGFVVPAFDTAAAGDKAAADGMVPSSQGGFVPDMSAVSSAAGSGSVFLAAAAGSASEQQKKPAAQGFLFDQGASAAVAEASPRSTAADAAAKASNVAGGAFEKDEGVGGVCLTAAQTAAASPAAASVKAGAEKRSSKVDELAAELAAAAASSKAEAEVEVAAAVSGEKEAAATKEESEQEQQKTAAEIEAWEQLVEARPDFAPPEASAACGEAPTAHVYMFGSGEMDQLPFWDDCEEAEDREVAVPRLVKQLQQKKIVKAACGALHSAVLTADGTCFTFGCADEGALGRRVPSHAEEEDAAAAAKKEGKTNRELLGGKAGNQKEQVVSPQHPGKVVLNGFVVHVAAGDSHTAFLTRSGSLYVCGSYRIMGM